MSARPESHREIKNMPRSRSGPGGMGLKRQVKDDADICSEFPHIMGTRQFN